MMNNLYSLVENYTKIYSELPWWLKIFFIVIQIVSIIKCLSLNYTKVTVGKKRRCSNTFHFFLWIAVIIVFPISGAFLYIICSFLPSFLCNKFSNKKIQLSQDVRNSIEKFINKKILPKKLIKKRICLLSEDFTFSLPSPLDVNISMTTWIITLASVILGLILGKTNLGNSIGVERGVFYYDIPLCTWIILTIIDFLKNYCINFVVISLTEKNQFDVKESNKTNNNDNKFVFPEDVFRGKESLFARTAADCFMSEGIVVPPGSEVFDNSCGRLESGIYYQYKEDNKRFINSNHDVCEAEYIGRGVIRYSLMTWVGDKKVQKQFVKNIRYRVSSPLRFVFFRAITLYLFIYVLCSPDASYFNSLVYLIEKKIGG